MDDRAEKVKNGIAAYSRDQAVILRLLRKRGQFTEYDFDRWFFRYPWRPRIYRGYGLDKSSFLLGGMEGYTRGWAWWLELVQCMGEIGLVRTERRDGVIVYLLGRKSPTAEFKKVG